MKEEKQIKDSIVLPAKTIEPLIFKLALTDVKYANLIMHTFNKGWFEDNVYGNILDICINKQYKVRNKLLSPETVSLLTDKIYSNSKDKNDHSNALRKVQHAFEQDHSKYDVDVLDKEIISYLKRAGQYFVITNSIEEMTKNNIDGCITDLQSINNMSFFDDIGFNYLQEFDEHKTELLNPASKISTGYNSLNKYTAGGYNKEGKQLILFMAEAGLGKSMMLSNSASRYLKAGKFVVIISLEMSEFVYLKRIDGQISNLDINTLDKNIDALESSVEALRNSQPDALLQIKEFPPNTVNCIQIKTYVDSLVRKYNRNPDCIIIDYLGLVMPNANSTSMNSYERLGKVAVEMRALSYYFECPVLSAVQSNRGSYNSTEMGLEHVGESMGIAHTADFIGGLFRDENDKQQGIMRLKILKNRLGGMQGTVLEFNVNYFTQVISEVDEYTMLDRDVDAFTKNLSKELDSLNELT